MNSAEYLCFSGYRWRIKTSEVPVGPGENRFFAASEAVRVEENGTLHLRIIPRQGTWYCSEVVLTEALGYGTYIFHVLGRVDRLPPEAVLGLFLWDDEPSFHHREIDIEFSRWGKAENSWNLQYVVQPFERCGNRELLSMRLVGDATTHTIRFTPKEAVFSSYHGFLEAEELVRGETDERHIHTWRYTESDLPPAGAAQVRINYWLYTESAEETGVYPEVMIRGFRFLPYAKEPTGVSER